MNKKLILSLSAAALLCNNLDAQSMLERFEAMELEMNALKQEIADLKSQKQMTLADDSDDEDEKVDLASGEDEDEGDDKEGDEGEEDEESEEFDIEEELEDIRENLSELNKNTNGSHLKFGVDYRYALENLQYKMADGSKAKNDALMTNRLWLNLSWKANSNLSFKGQLAYNKVFGQRSIDRSNPTNNTNFENFDWISSESAYNDTLRVRSAYFYYHNRTFLGTDIPWTMSIGRRPSTGGKLINLRDDDRDTSPLAHAINVEFDGLSSKFSFKKYVQGMYVKFCAGRGMSNATPMFSATPYSQDDAANSSIDMLGVIFAPYDNNQYSVTTQYYYANNLIDMSATVPNAIDTVGGIHSASANLTVKGIGNEWSDFLDDSTFFVSAAMSKTNPKDGKAMLGSTQSETGTSFWIGAQFPSLMSDDGKMGFEYNHGSKYWRSMTYGEDTSIGSKIAARGNAYEAYFTEYLSEEKLSLQLRYTYIDYEYSGSNGFFGSTTGTPMTMDQAVAAGYGNRIVDSAQDIRLYLRYKY